MHSDSRKLLKLIKNLKQDPVPLHSVVYHSLMKFGWNMIRTSHWIEYLINKKKLEWVTENITLRVKE